MQLKKKTFNKIIFLAIVIIVIFFLYPKKETQIYQFESNTLNYAKDRGPTNHDIEFLYTNNSIDVYKLSYKSRPFIDQETTIHALLYVPNDKENVPGVVYLPAGGATKESRSALTTTITGFGYAVLIIDQRGIGETGGVYLNFQDDYNIFAQGDEPIQHLSVFDALKSFDVLREIENVNKDNIAMLGISMDEPLPALKDEVSTTPSPYDLTLLNILDIQSLI